MFQPYSEEDYERIVACAICVADGVNPTKICIGMGNIKPVGYEGPAWHFRIKQARAAIEAYRDALNQL